MEGKKYEERREERNGAWKKGAKDGRRKERKGGRRRESKKGEKERRKKEAKV